MNQPNQPGDKLAPRIKIKPSKHTYFDQIRGKQLLDRIIHVRNSAGAKHARDYFSGVQISQGRAVLANCAECMGWYADGMRDCEQPECPLYHWMPYRAGRKRWIRPERREPEPEKS